MPASTPPQPPSAAVPPPELQIEQAFIFCVNITPAGVSHGWKSQGRAGVGRGRQGREGWGEERRGEGRAFSSTRMRGKKENTNFLCRQFNLSAPEEEKYPLFPPSILQTPISVRADSSLPLTALSITKNSSWLWSLVPCAVQDAVGAALPAQLKPNHPN